MIYFYTNLIRNCEIFFSQNVKPKLKAYFREESPLPSAERGEEFTGFDEVHISCITSNSDNRLLLGRYDAIELIVA